MHPAPSISGVHRSLGAHVSRVRSLVLDSIEPLAISVLLQLGNGVSGLIFEDPDELHRVGWSKPTPSSTRAERDRFIRAKYADLQFVAPLSAPPELILQGASESLVQEAGRLSDDTALNALLSSASQEGHLPLVLWCLVQRSKWQRSGSSSTIESSLPDSIPLHAATLRSRWACVYLLLSYTGWEPPGEPDSSGRSVWQAALQAVSETATGLHATRGPDLHAAETVAMFENLVSALVGLLVRPPDRRAALSSALETLHVIIDSDVVTAGP